MGQLIRYCYLRVQALMNMTLHVTKPTLHLNQLVLSLRSPRSALMGTVMAQLLDSKDNPHSLYCLIACSLISFKENNNKRKKGPNQNAVHAELLLYHLPTNLG